ncbi:HNH endonuclease [Achromobacter denitrificans]
MDYNYYAFNIGDPVTAAWWAENCQRGVITTGFDGKPGDEGERTLLRMNEGDWIFAYAKGHGFVGAGRFANRDTYRLHPKPPTGSFSSHCHERQVRWLHVIANVNDAIKAQDVGAHAPRHTAERIHDTIIAERILSRLMNLGVSALGAQRAAPMNDDRCELWGPAGWHVVSIIYALMRPDGIIRCRECHGAIQIHVAGPQGVPRMHAEHRIGHPGCSLGHYFNGTRTPHPSPVSTPTDPTQIASSSVALEDDESAFPEGGKSYTLHRKLERDGKLPRRVKADRLATTGKLACDVCAFDFTARYGALGVGFIEAHHRRPVHQLNGKEKTKAKDLALVCSNCHRMLHRTMPPLSVEDLKTQLMLIPTS